MNPEITHYPERKVVGMSSKMKQTEYHKIPVLWKQFMPRKSEISHQISTNLIAIQVYPKFTNDQNISEYDIWACVEVSNFENIPVEMEGFRIPEGEYAVFPHKGMDASATYQRIMTEWLPNSGYEIDDRPHFQVMGANYKNGSPDSEEDFYVPVKLKS